MRSPSPSVVLQKPLSAGIAVIVEGDHAVRHVDMVAVEILARNDPFAVESVQGRMAEEGARKDVAGAVAEEDAIR
ncbi:hypothetical protein X767_29400 [Mesorhizobium sp. LSJC264A00]|nr:hypothetical protein X767_29400 [Mesorhizobium sp. LSJC264A00]ESX56678.1 hypothetical protein X761_09400 [Mesorhizobium sp. LSHC424B00]